MYILYIYIYIYVYVCILKYKKAMQVMCSITHILIEKIIFILQQLFQYVTHTIKVVVKFINIYIYSRIRECFLI